MMFYILDELPYFLPVFSDTLLFILLYSTFINTDNF